MIKVQAMKKQALLGRMDLLSGSVGCVFFRGLVSMSFYTFKRRQSQLHSKLILYVTGRFFFFVTCTYEYDRNVNFILDASTDDHVQ